MKFFAYLLSLTLLAGFAVACSSTDDDGGDEGMSDDSGEMSESSDDEEMMPATVVDVAMSSDDHTTLVTALDSAELVAALQADGPFTVFAPTNEAFAAMQDTVDMLMMDENRDQFVAVLTYHVVPGKMMAADLSDGDELETLQGEMLTVRVDESGAVMLEDANGGMATITAVDMEAGNGVVHVIDTVVTPGM